MGIMGRIRKMFRPPVYRTYTYGAASAHVDDMTIAELYRTQPQLRTVISFLASNVAQLPLKVYVRESDTSRRRDTTSRLATLLRHPNPEMTGYELIYNLMSDLKLYDMALWLIAEDATTDSGFVIRPIPPIWINGYEGGDLFSPEVVIVQNPETGQEVRLGRDDRILWHGYSPEDPRYGASPVEALKMILKEQIEGWSYRRQIWDRGSRIPAYISRPIEAEAWDDEDMERFAEGWRDAYSHRGHGAGSTPVLEDGMKIVASPSMDMDAVQWEQSNVLGLQTVCAVYHLKTGMIVSGQSTYASAKDNARALYTDTLGPDIRMIQERLTRYLVPRVGADSRSYIEFDLNEKLNGSFLDLAQVLQSSVGAPWLTRNEARAMVNREAIDGGDDLIVPLNVISGGLASPRDTTASSYGALSGESRAIKRMQSEPEEKQDPAALIAPAFSPDPFSRFTRIETEIEDEDRERIEKTLAKFFARQQRAVLSALGASKAAKADGDPEWFDGERWDRELGEDLFAVLRDLVDRYGEEVIRNLAEDEDAWAAPKTEAYVRAVAEAQAHAINRSTLRDLLAAVSGEVPDGDEKATPRGVFEYAKTFRAVVLGTMLATRMSSWAAGEAVRQSGRSDILKQWVVTSGNPRDTHAALNGEVVPFDGRFSNGAKWPGDTGALGVDEVAGCQCRVDLLIP